MVGTITVTAAAQGAEVGAAQAAAALAQPDTKLANVAPAEGAAQPAGTAEQMLPATGSTRSLALALVAAIAAAGGGLVLRTCSSRDGWHVPFGKRALALRACSARAMSGPALMIVDALGK